MTTSWVKNDEAWLNKIQLRSCYSGIEYVKLIQSEKKKPSKAYSVRSYY